MALTDQERKRTFGIEVQTASDTNSEPINVEELKEYIAMMPRQVN